MWAFWVFFFSQIVCLLTFVGSVRPPRIVHPADGLCQLLVAPKLNYDCQEYLVETGDGFLLGVQRMSSRRFTGATKQPVFVLHGILLGGDIWVLNAPSESLGFILADAGYDVWIGNTRTSRFTYGHVTYKRTDEVNFQSGLMRAIFAHCQNCLGCKKYLLQLRTFMDFCQGFWDWSLDDLVDEDLPAMVGLIYSTTGSRTHYVGYSEGSQQGFAAFSEGQLLKYVNKVVMLAPVAYVTHGTAPLEVALLNLGLNKALEAAQIKALSFQTPMRKEVVDLVCGPKNVLCYKGYLYFISGTNCCINQSKRALIDAYEPQATSVKNLAQFAQQARQARFARFDYGTMGNLARYGSVKSPEYKLAKVPTENLLLVTGGNDQIADAADVARLLKELAGNPKLVSSPHFGHLDFALADNANTEIYNHVLAFLQS